ncbi:uncharacterized protein LOC106469827 [Limulus polyphemus]|uniref:Uncharacterized protein LOC106469827 n=1 Tax=Limulus polyphemus TaxID=6850 RepID=A0ABM1BNX0_LIMPO|nr:uncharacterized protein LOC106469827 [Limulus polyphemus]
MNNQTDRFQCYSCAGDSCKQQELAVCSDALMCYSYSVSDSFGYQTFHKGCVAEDKAQFFCNTLHHGGKEPSTAEYSGECCQGNYCNNGTFPTLAPFMMTCKFKKLCVTVTKM